MADLASFKSRERESDKSSLYCLPRADSDMCLLLSSPTVSILEYEYWWEEFIRCVWAVRKMSRKDGFSKKQMWYVWSLFNVNQSPFYYRVIDYGRRGTQCWEQGRKASSSFKLYSQSSDKKNIKLSEGLLCFIDSAIFDPLERNWCFPKKEMGSNRT